MQNEVFAFGKQAGETVAFSLSDRLSASRDDLDLRTRYTGCEGGGGRREGEGTFPSVAIGLFMAQICVSLRTKNLLLKVWFINCWKDGYQLTRKTTIKQPEPGLG